MANTKANDGEEMPDELNELSNIVEEFIRRLSTLEVQLAGLKEDRKDLIDEYRKKLDMKTLNTAMKIVKAKRATEHKHTLDVFLEIIEKRDLGV